MTFRNLISLTLTAVALSVLTSCESEPYMITTEEVYTRNFITTFGLIDPNQDWNMAEAGHVTVNVGEHAKSVKVYCKVREKYYIVADLVDVNGSVNVSIDIPEGCNDLKVKVDGKVYSTVNGGKVDASNSASSRSVNSGTENYTSYSTSATIGGQSVTVTATNTDNYFYFNSLQMTPITSKTIWPDYYSVSTQSYVTNTKSATGILPESDLMGDKKKNIDAGKSHIKSGIYDDFMFQAAENSGRRTFTLYPMFWNTQQTHTLGIYFRDETENKLYKFPIYTDKLFDGDITEYYPAGGQNGSNTSATTNVSTTGTAVVVDGPQQSSGGGGSSSTIAQTITFQLWVDIRSNPWTSNIQWLSYSDGVDNYSTINNHKMETFVNANFNFKRWTEQNNVNIDNDITKTPEGSVLGDYNKYTLTSLTTTSTDGGTRWEATAVCTYNVSSGAPQHYSFTSSRAAEDAYTVDETLYQTALLNSTDNTYWGKPYSGGDTRLAYDSSNQMLLRSRGVEITIDGYDGEFGMYIDFGGISLYSQRDMNDSYAGGIRYPETVNGVNVYGDKAGTLASSFAVSYKHPVTERLFFSFEDWTDSGSDGDLNDLVFMFSGVNKIVLKDEEIDIEDDPDPDFVDIDTPISWLVAAEDLGATDDFDFNDVVFRITSVTTNRYSKDDVTGTPGNYTPNEGATAIGAPTKRVTVKALAAGGTLEVYLHYMSGSTDYVIGPNGVVEASQADDSYEWHKWFGSGFDCKTMINTGAGPSVSTTAEVEVTEYINMDDFTVATYSKSTDKTLNGFFLTVGGYDTVGDIGGSITNADGDTSVTVIGQCETGAAPQMFLIKDDGNTWQWPAERVRMFVAYPKFGDWVTSSDPSWITSDPSAQTCRPVK